MTDAAQPEELPPDVLAVIFYMQAYRQGFEAGRASAAPISSARARKMRNDAIRKLAATKFRMHQGVDPKAQAINLLLKRNPAERQRLGGKILSIGHLGRIIRGEI